MNPLELESLSKKIRIEVIKMLAKAGSGHTAGSLDVVDILVSLYFSVLKHDPKKPTWEDRDRFVLSAGHMVPALYAVLAEAGYFSTDRLETLRKLGSPLQGHPHYDLSIGIEASSGPLGQGISVAAGMALAGKIDKQPYHIYCLVSDGEHDEGQLWEAIMFCAKYKLNNLTLIIDRNNIQIDGLTEEIMPLEPLDEKYRAFNWYIEEVDGHNIDQLIKVFEKSKNQNKPTAIIANTIPGKGVSFFERDYHWHGKAPSQEEAALAIKELESA
ncbi:MAG: transketolase [bacterium]|nr:transketolase [bacterium]